jgi:Tol biopolymer transport system component
VQNRFTDHQSINAYPLWSRDGSHVTFSSSRSGPFDLFEKPASGGEDEHLRLASPKRKWAADWSPDGRVLLYVERDDKMDVDLWAASNVDGVKKVVPVVQTRFDEDQGQFSPDARWIAYRSNESGQAEIYVRPFPGPGRPQQVSIAGGNQPRWRRDGTELFFVASDRKLMAVAVRLSAEGPTLKIGTPNPLFSTRLGDEVQPRAQYAVAADGQRFLMNAVLDDATATPITIVQNWPGGMKK